MLNRTEIVKAFNAKNNKRVKADDEKVISAFLDMELFDGVTDEIMLELIERGLITTKEELVDRDKVTAMWTWCKEHPRVEEVEVVEDDVPETPAESPEPSEGAPAKAEMPEFPEMEPSGGAFGGFEQAINMQVHALVKKALYPALDVKFANYLQDNPSKTKKRVVWCNSKNGKESDGVVHAEFGTVTAVIDAGEPVMMIGPAGSGKNFLAKQAADFLGLEFYFANAVQQPYQLTGFIDANGVFHETQFYKAFTLGGLFLFDEIDASVPEVLVEFNASLENGYMDFPTGRVYAHKDFRVIAAANTTGDGASYEYTGRLKLDAATKDRFTPIEIGYDKAIEETITDDKDLIEFVRGFRGACAEHGIHHVTSYRSIRRCDKFKPLGIAKALKMGLLKSMEKDDLNMLLDDFKGKANVWAKAFCEIARGC